VRRLMWPQRAIASRPTSSISAQMSCLGRDGAETAAFLLAHPQCGLAVVDQSEQAGFEAGLGDASVRQLAVLEGYNAVKGRDLTLRFYTLENSALQAPAQ
jgi:hypothetical protein